MAETMEVSSYTPSLDGSASASKWTPEVIQRASQILLHCVSEELDLSTTKKQLKEIAGITEDEISPLIQYVSPTVLQTLHASSVAPSATQTSMATGISSVPLAGGATISPENAELGLGRDGEDGTAMDVSSDSNLSSGDRIKLEFIKEVSATFQNPEAVGLARGFSSGQLSFAEVVQLIPASFIRAPHLIERFACLTNHPAQRQVLARLSAAVSQLATCIVTVPGPLRRQVCQEVAALVAHQTFPSRTSATREFAFFACQRAMPTGFVLPRLQGQPQLHFEDASSVRPEPTSRRSATAANTTNTVNATATNAPTGTNDGAPLQQQPTSLSGNASATQTSGYGPSYTRRPSSYEPPRCSSRNALGDSVLNDYFHCAGSGSEGSSQDTIRNPHQEALFRLEEDALCVDILIGRAQSCVRVLTEIGRRLELLAQQNYVIMAAASGERVRAVTPTEVINASLLPIHVDTFRVIAKNRTSMVIADPITHFHADPSKFIVEMTRLCMFQADEHVRIRRCFGKLWKQVFAHQYVQSHDHRVYRMKNDDKHMMSPKAILSHLNLEYHEALVSGRQDALDFQQLLDFSHFRYSLLPYLTHTKSQRYQQEHVQSNEHAMDTDAGSNPQNIPNLVPPNVREIIDSLCLDLLEVGGSKILSPADNKDTVQWMRETFSVLFASPDPSLSDKSLPVQAQKIVCGPLQLYVVLRMYHTLHERVRLAYWLAQNFTGSCWQFSDVVPPSPPSTVPAPSPQFLQFITYDNETPPVPATVFNENPPSPFFELSTLYLDSQPDYIAQWESESAPVARLTRAGAISSSGLLLGGAPPQPNLQLHHSIVRQAAQLRNTPPAPSNRPNYTVNNVAPPVDSITEAEAIASLPPLKDDILSTPPDQRFPTYLNILKGVLKGSVEASTYDLQVMKLLGPEAYPLYSLPRLLTNMVAQVRLMMSLPGRQPWYQLWAEHTESTLLSPPKNWRSYRASMTRYLEQASSLSEDHKFVEFRISSSGNISYKVHQRTRNQSDAKGLSRLLHEAYIKSWNSPKLDGVSISQRRIFLQRNVAKQLPENVNSEPLTGRAPSWDLAQSYQVAQSSTVSGPPTFVSLDPSTWRLSREAFSTDWKVRRTRHGGPQQPPAHLHNPTSQLHQITAKLAQTAPQHIVRPSENPKVQEELRKVGLVVETELARPDLVVVEAAPVETVSSRVHKRKTKKPLTKDSEANGESDGEDGDYVENAENASDGSPEAASEGSSVPDNAAYQMQVD